MLDLCQTKYQHKNIQIKTDIKKLNFPTRDKLNNYEFFTVLWNVVDNAMKYSAPKSNIDIKIFQRERHNKFLLSTFNGLVCQVTDNGSGIPKKDQEAVFEMGYRAKEEIIAKTKGTGYGLARVKKLLTGKGGYQINVESPVKGRKGTRITFEFATLD